jgi:ArsR family transcriptional regulator, arsenate/arsenite/antimonite-responsive transcriptional repressor
VEKVQAIQVMSALSQPTRFEIFRLLAAAVPEGMASGEIAGAVGAPPNTISAHLAILERAGLVGHDRVGRLAIYRAETTPVLQLSAMLAGACEEGSSG